LADRIEREIEEILRKIDDFVPERPRRTPRKRTTPVTQGPTGQSWVGSRFSRISMNQVMGYSLILVVAAFIFSAVPGAGWLMIGSLIVFATAFLISTLGGGSGRKAERRWRGEDIDLSGPAWPDRLKAWIKGRRQV
jgi:hypothetical protein